jgi:uncharacterized coiled-coil DUF342 family protein
MNDTRRKQIAAIREKLATIQTELEDVRDAEQDYYDNMPESFQNSDKGEKADQAVAFLNDAYNDLETVIDSLMSAEE